MGLCAAFRAFLRAREFIEGHEEEKDGVDKGRDRPETGEQLPVPDAEQGEKQGGHEHDGDASPAIGGMQKAHDALFVLCGAGFDDGGDDDFEQPRARRIEKGGGEKPRHGRKNAGEKGEQDKPERAQEIARGAAGSVADFVHEFPR